MSSILGLISSALSLARELLYRLRRLRSAPSGRSTTPAPPPPRATLPRFVAIETVVTVPRANSPGCRIVDATTPPAAAMHFVCFTANVTSAWTLAIDASTPRYPRDLIIIGTNGSIIPSYVTDLRTGSAAATNLIYVRPQGSTTNWYIK